MSTTARAISAAWSTSGRPSAPVCWGAFVDGTLAGFAGFHGEGSIGPSGGAARAYRRRGLGKRPGGGAAGAGAGQYAFGQVLIDNAPSWPLQKRWA